MDNWFNNKWFVRAISLAFAIFLFVFVNLEGTTTHTDSRIPSESDKEQTLNDVPVDIRIDSDKFVVSGVPEFVTVSLEGTNSVLTPIIMQRNFDLYVDLQELGEGTHTVDIEHAKIPNELSVYIDPKTIEVTIEERASKEFSVTVDFINKDKLPDGFELGEPEVNPDKVTITSSRSIIDKIAMVKVYIDVGGLTESINNREVPVNVYDSQGNGLNVRVEPESAVVSVSVDNPSKKVPIDVATKGELPEEYELTSIAADQEDVEVFGSRNVLTGVEEISTEEIDLSKLTESGTIDVKLVVPDGIIVTADEIKVTIKIEKQKTDAVKSPETSEAEESVLIKDVSINVDSLEQQKVLFLIPSNPAMGLTVVGKENNISKLTVDDFKLSIDTKELDVGEHQIPVSIEGPDDVTLSAEFEQVTIEIT